MLYHTLITPYFNYCIIAWANSSQRDIDRLFFDVFECWYITIIFSNLNPLSLLNTWCCSVSWNLWTPAVCIIACPSFSRDSPDTEFSSKSPPCHVITFDSTVVMKSQKGYKLLQASAASRWTFLNFIVQEIWNSSHYL